MMNSTEIVGRITDAIKIRRYYTIFLGAMSATARGFGAKIVKNAGDSVIFYFPQTSDSADRRAFQNVLECGITMAESHHMINRELAAEGLPAIDYRISADYGRVEVAVSATSRAADLFGPTMNMCAKINCRAGSHGMVVGGDLYQILRSLSLDDRYHLDPAGGCSVGFRYAYPVYSVAGRKNGGSLARAPGQGAKHPIGSPRLQNVMVIDDEQDILMTFEGFLTSEGFVVDAFSDSQDALERFAQAGPSHYDLIIMDIRMPKINGLQLYQRFKALSANIKIIFVSCLDAAEELVTMLPEVKSSEVLRKPVDQEYFMRVVKSCAA
jgi:two-component system, OmpR family, response regulator ChvI